MQLRGIHQGLVVYAYTNKDWYPGLDSLGLYNLPDELGTQNGIDVADRNAMLLDGGFVSPEYLIASSETDESIVPWPGEGRVTAAHSSFAMLQVPESGGRHDEWQQTLNSQAIVLSDRNTGTQDQTASIHADEEWFGQVLWNDNHVAYEHEPALETQYGEGELNEQDDLFSALGRDDALLIHSGN